MNKILFMIIAGFLMLSTPVLAESYRTIENKYVQRQSDLALIPCNSENSDYLQYLKDVKSGAEVSPYDYKAEDARQEEAQSAAKEITDREALIQEKIISIAVVELKKEGKLDSEERVTTKIK